MSQDFNLNLDGMFDQDLPPEQGGHGKQLSHYIEPSHQRNLCFEWPEGRKLFLGYSYLISGEFNPDESTIKLEFTHTIVLLKGMQLEDLFFLLLGQSVRLIKCVDERYNIIKENEYVVNEIIVTKTE